MDVNRQWYQVLGEEGIFDCDALVQLTGAPYLEKHVVPNAEVKQHHLHTRSSLTTLLAKAMPRTKFKPLVFIQGSHVGIYPSRYAFSDNL
jgi:NAD dependent epimerase/dehydratase family enzyme